MGIARLRDNFVHTILPNWLSAGYDSSAGQFVEALDLDGTAERSGIVRVRTAARQIYVYAHAAALGLVAEGGLEKAETAFANLHRSAWVTSGRPGYASSFDINTARIIDGRQDLYDHACVLLALAWLSKATGAEKYDELIREATAAIDVTLRSAFGGWAEDDAGTMPRRQNPHMHYFEACLALWETGHGYQYAARAGELFSLFKSRFWDEDIATIREYFGPSWDVSRAFKSGRLDPGHMAEWAWLVTRYERLTGEDHSYYADKLLTAALQLGRIRTSPFLADEVTCDGCVLVDRRRLWPQAELLKALVVRDDPSVGRNLREDADIFADQLSATYLADAPGGFWLDAFDCHGAFTAEQIPGSSLYHLWTVIPETIIKQTDTKMRNRNSSHGTSLGVL